MLFPLEADCPAFDTSVLRAVLSDFYVASTQWYALMIEYQVGWHLSKMVMIPCKLTNICTFARHVRIHVVLVHWFRFLDGSIHLDPPLERPIAITSSSMLLAMSQPRTVCQLSRCARTYVERLLSRSLQIWDERSRGGDFQRLRCYSPSIRTAREGSR